MRSMSSLEYSYWMALAGMEPIGPERGDYHAALVASTLANVNRDAKQRPSAYELNDFLLFHERPELDEDEILQELLMRFPMPDKPTQH